MGWVWNALFGDDAPQEVKNADLTVMQKATFLACFARETGHFGPVERQWIIDLAFRGAEISRFPRAHVAESLDQWAHNDEFLGSTLILMRSDEDLRGDLLTDTFKLAAIDGDLDDGERAWIQSAFEAMGGTAKEFWLRLVFFHRAVPETSELGAARELLGVSAGASKSEINSRYRELSLAYHPDRHMSADPKLRDLAAEKFAKIASAYSLLIEQREQALYGRADGVQKIVAGQENRVVNCFICRQRCRLPSPEHLARVRCPNCKRLLLFDMSTATTLLTAW